MLENIVYFKVLGFSVMAWFGIFTLISLVLAGYFGINLKKADALSKHKFFAILTFVFVAIHVILGLLRFF